MAEAGHPSVDEEIRCWRTLRDSQVILERKLDGLTDSLQQFVAEMRRELRSIRAHGVPSSSIPEPPPLIPPATLPDWGDRRNPARDFRRGRREPLDILTDEDPCVDLSLL